METVREKPPVEAEQDQPRVYPVSFAQRRLWFLDRLAPGGSAYVITEAVRLTGPLDVAALRAAVTILVRRHDALRTVFATVDGEPVQVVQPAEAMPDVLEVAPGGDPDRLLSQWAGMPFDLASGPPVRALLVPDGADEWVFALAVHHAA